MSLGADASFTHQDAAQLAADGVKAIGRYCPGGNADPGKCLTAAELDALPAHGIAVWLVYELSAARWRGGYPAGREDGQAARLGARAIGWPETRPIYTGFDENVGPADQATATGYQQGFNDGQGAVGAHPGGAAYGDGFVLRILSEARLIAWKWLSDSSAFTESAAYARSGQASIVQFYGRTLPGLSGIDVDDLLVADFGQSPAPSAASVHQEDDLLPVIVTSPSGTSYVNFGNGLKPIPGGKPTYDSLVKVGAKEVHVSDADIKAWT